MTAATEARVAAPVAIGRIVVPLLGLAVFINYVDRGNLATAAPLIKDQLHLSAVQLGVLISAFSWTYVPGQVLAGWLGEKLNPYRTLALGLAIWSVATIVTGVATGFAMLLGLRLLLGLGESAAFPCSSKLIAQHLPAHKLGGANAWISQGIALGPAFGTLAGGLLMAAAGWRVAFLVFGLVSLLWLVPWLFSTRGMAAKSAAHEALDAPSFGAIVARRELWGAALGHFSVNYGFYFLISWLPLYLVKVQGYSMSGMAKLGSLVYVAYAVGGIIGGQVTDRWMSAGASPNTARKTLTLVTHTLATAGFAACALGGPQVAIGALFIIAFAFGATSPNIFAIGQTLAGPRAAGKWIGVQNCLGNIPGIIGPIITGYLLDSAGGFPVAFAVAAGASFLGVIGWGLIIPKIAQVEWAKA